MNYTMRNDSSSSGQCSQFLSRVPTDLAKLNIGCPCRRLVAQRHSLCSGSDIIHHPTCYTPSVLLNWKWKWWRWRWMRVVASALPINKIGEIEIFICFRRRSIAKGSSGAGQSNRDKEKSINWFVVGSECFSADTFSLSLFLFVTSYQLPHRSANRRNETLWLNITLRQIPEEEEFNGHTQNSEIPPLLIPFQFNWVDHLHTLVLSCSTTDGGFKFCPGSVPSFSCQLPPGPKITRGQ